MLLLIHRHQIGYHIVVLSRVLVSHGFHLFLEAIQCLFLHELLRWVRHHLFILRAKVLTRVHIGQALQAGLFQVGTDEWVRLEVIRIDRSLVHLLLSLHDGDVVGGAALRVMRLLVQLWHFLYQRLRRVQLVMCSR